jgi:FkbM family methyltransferase
MVKTTQEEINHYILWRDVMLPRISQVKCVDAEYMLFSVNDGISVSLFTEGKWDEHILSISKLFYSGIDAPLILDIGSHIGTYAIPVAKDIQNSGGKVIAFEPQRIVYYQLCGNIILNRLDNCFALNQAVGNYNGDISIPEIDYNINNNVGAFSLHKEYRERHDIERSMLDKKNNVPMIKLDSLHLEKSPSLIKIDVEGLELNVLKGAVNTLENNNFPPILFEAWRWDWFDKEREELLNYVKYLGYNVDLIFREDYIAQHPNNSVEVKFINQNGVVHFQRAR